MTELRMYRPGWCPYHDEEMVPIVKHSYSINRMVVSLSCLSCRRELAQKESDPMPVLQMARGET